MKMNKKIILVVLALSITLNQVLAINFISVEEAAKKGWIKLTVKSKGGFTGEVIEMKIKNLCHQLLNLKLEAGRRLDSKNNGEQDILVTKHEEIALNTDALKTLKVFGMCCQAHNASPTKDADYSIGKMSDSSLIRLAEFIDKNKYYDSHTAQGAVWAVSDNESIGGIAGEDKEEVTKLRSYVSALTHRPIPKYDVNYGRGNNERAMGRATTVEGTFDFTLTANAHVSVGIYDSLGTLVQVIFKDQAHQKGIYRFHFVFRTSRLQQGTYYARLNKEGRTEKEMRIEF